MHEESTECDVAPFNAVSTGSVGSTSESSAVLKVNRWMRHQWTGGERKHRQDGRKQDGAREERWKEREGMRRQMEVKAAKRGKTGLLVFPLLLRGH